MPGRKYTDDQISEALALREKGLSYGQIEHKTGMNQKSVSWYCLINGADSPQMAKTVPKPSLPMVYQRNGVTVRRFSPQDDETILSLTASGHLISEIARALDRRHNSVKARLSMLARNEGRRELAEA